MKISGYSPKILEDLKNILKNLKEVSKKEENLKVGSAKIKEKPSSQTEVVEVSSQKLIESAIQKILSMPEIREEKVAQIKAQIQSGTYNVSNREIARAMIANLLDKIA
uniref:Negative regulator of flagellin synthesis n=1 Tax=Thermodesulfobacterium geofontis TaxID=1295609 RepID=A0A7V4N502_9BACT